MKAVLFETASRLEIERIRVVFDGEIGVEERDEKEVDCLGMNVGRTESEWGWSISKPGGVETQGGGTSLKISTLEGE